MEQILSLAYDYFGYYTLQNKEKKAIKRCFTRLQRLYQLSERELVRAMCLITIPKGTRLFHGAFYRMKKYPRDGKELPLQGGSLKKVRSYQGAWFSYSDSASVLYALKAVGKKEWDPSDSHIDPSVWTYLVKKPITQVINMAMFIDREKEEINVSSLLQLLTELLPKRERCHDWSELEKGLLQGEFSQTNYFLAALLCKCSNSKLRINGWLNLSDSKELFICHPGKYLQLSIKSRILWVHDGKELHSIQDYIKGEVPNVNGVIVDKSAYPWIPKTLSNYQIYNSIYGLP